MKEIIGSKTSGKPIIPDQVLLESEIGLPFKDLEAIMDSCPGYDWLGEESSPPNWPPKRGIVHSLKALFSNISFAIKKKNR